MKMIVDFGMFNDSFERYGRKDNFSFEGLRALFYYLEDLENLEGNEYELDVIAICCYWTEYDTLKEALEAYNLESKEELEENTTVIYVDNQHVIVNDY